MPGFKAREYPNKICVNPSCGKEFNRKRHSGGHLEPSRSYRQRKYCDKACWEQDRGPTGPIVQSARQRELVEDLRWIIGTDSIVNVATRLGYKSPYTLERSLGKAGEPALANRVRQEYQHYQDALIGAGRD
jgi:hypothetical protein